MRADGSNGIVKLAAGLAAAVHHHLARCPHDSLGDAVGEEWQDPLIPKTNHTT
jgi:hypothetical protein